MDRSHKRYHREKESNNIYKQLTQIMIDNQHLYEINNDNLTEKIYIN